MHSLNKKRFLVIGGSSGIGLAVAKLASGAGADVTIASRFRSNLDRALADIQNGVAAAELNTGDETAVRHFFSSTAPWDHIVISAAQTPTGPLRALNLDDARSAMESKFWGAHHVARAANFNEGGSLTFVSGFLSVRPSAGAVLQGAINAALEALARGLALELAPTRVNTVSPGIIKTPLWDSVPKETRDAIFADAAAHLPVRRIGQPEDIANAVLFLTTTPFATGSTVLVDGGGAIS